MSPRHYFAPGVLDMGAPRSPWHGLGRVLRQGTALACLVVLCGFAAGYWL